MGLGDKMSMLGTTLLCPLWEGFDPQRFWSFTLFRIKVLKNSQNLHCFPVYTGTAWAPVMSFRTMSLQVAWCSEEEPLGALQDLRKTSTKAGQAPHCWQLMLIHCSDLCTSAIDETYGPWRTLRFDISEVTTSCIMLNECGVSSRGAIEPERSSVMDT